MAAPKGNRFWEMRSSHGCKPKFESPEQLWTACCEYFEWVGRGNILRLSLKLMANDALQWSMNEAVQYFEERDLMDSFMEELEKLRRKVA